MSTLRNPKTGLRPGIIKTLFPELNAFLRIPIDDVREEPPLPTARSGPFETTTPSQSKLSRDCSLRENTTGESSANP